MSDITDDGDNFDLHFEDSVLIEHNFDEFVDSSNYQIDDYNDDVDIIDNNSIDYI